MSETNTGTTPNGKITQINVQGVEYDIQDHGLKDYISTDYIDDMGLWIKDKGLTVDGGLDVRNGSIHAENALIAGDSNKGIGVSEEGIIINNGTEDNPNTSFQVNLDGEVTAAKVTIGGIVLDGEDSTITINGGPVHAVGQITEDGGEIFNAYEAGKDGIYEYSANEATFGGHAEGASTKALAIGSHAEGFGSIVEKTALASHVEGFQTKAIGVTTHVEGDMSIAVGSSSHAQGNHTIALGKNSSTEGKDTQTGYYTEDDNYYYYVDDDGKLVSVDKTQNNSEQFIDVKNYIGRNAHAQGDGSKAYGNHSDAGGFQTTAKGAGSITRGYLTTAEGANSAAFGSETNAIAECSTALGWNTVTNRFAQTVVGQLNNPNKEAFFIVGTGSDENNKKNTLEVYDDYIRVSNIHPIQGESLNIVANTTGIKVISDGEPIYFETNGIKLGQENTQLFDFTGATPSFTKGLETTSFKLSNYTIEISENGLPTDPEENTIYLVIPTEEDTE